MFKINQPIPYDEHFQVHIRGYGWGLRFPCSGDEISLSGISGYVETEDSPHSPEALLEQGDSVFLQLPMSKDGQTTIEAEVTQKNLVSGLCQLSFRFEQANEDFFPLLQELWQKNFSTTRPL